MTEVRIFFAASLAELWSISKAEEIIGAAACFAGSSAGFAPFAATFAVTCLASAFPFRALSSRPRILITRKE